MTPNTQADKQSEQVPRGAIEAAEHEIQNFLSETSGFERGSFVHEYARAINADILAALGARNRRPHERSTMKIEIEISEEDAACIWANAWKKRPLIEVATDILRGEAANYRREYPKAVPTDVADFRAALAPTPKETQP